MTNPEYSTLLQQARLIKRRLIGGYRATITDAMARLEDCDPLLRAWHLWRIEWAAEAIAQLEGTQR